MLAVVLPVLAGLRWSGYSHRSQWISELGAHEAPDGGLVSAGFVLIGLLLAAGGVALVRTQAEPRSVVWAAAVVALALGGSYLVSGVAPCDPGCPDAIDTNGADGADGTGEEIGTGQQVHDVAGVLGYTVAVYGVVAFAYATRGSDGLPASLAVAAVVVVAGLASAAADDWAGALQRIMELALLGWLVEVVRRLTAAPPVSEVIRPTGPTAVLSDFASRDAG